MSTICLRKANGDMLEVTLNTLFNLLAESCKPTDVLSCLNRRGQVAVELQDGRAEIWRAADRPLSRALTQPALPLCEFVADARLHFELPARIHCRAGSPSEAKHLIEETINGERGLAPGFNIEINPADVQAVIASLDIGSMSVIESVTINRIDQQRLLTRSSLT